MQPNTVLPGHDRGTGWREFADVRDVDLPVRGRSTGGQVEIAIVQEPVPGKTEEASGHEPFHRGGIEPFRERFQIPIVISRPKKRSPGRSRAGTFANDREPVERDPHFRSRSVRNFRLGGALGNGRSASRYRRRSSRSRVSRRSTPYPAAFSFFSTAIAASVVPAPRWASAGTDSSRGRRRRGLDHGRRKEREAPPMPASLTAERFVRSIKRGASGQARR